MSYTLAEIDGAIAKARAANDAEAVQYLSSLKPAASDPGFIDYARSALSGASLGFADEVGAGLLAGYEHLTGRDNFSDAYNMFRNRERGELSRFRENHPGKAFATEMAGGLLTGLAGGAKAGVTAVGRNILSKGVGARMAAASGIGAGTGAVVGAGEAKELADVPGAMVAPAVAGAVLGPLAEGGVSLAQKAGSAVNRHFLDPAVQADVIVGRALKDAGLSPQQAGLKVAGMGPKSVLADVSEATQTKLDDLAQAPGATRARASQQLGARSEGQVDQVEALVGSGSKFDALEAIQERLKKSASPKYKQAFEEGVGHTPELERVFKTLEQRHPGVWKEAKADGVFALEARGEKVDPAVFGDDVRPSLQGWQALKEWIDKKADSLARTDTPKKAAPYKDIRRRLLNELDRLNPKYAEARAEWAGEMAFKEAIESAKKFMTASSAETRQMLKGMGSAEREAYKIGAIQSIVDKIERDGLTHDTAKHFKKTHIARKFKALFGDAEAARLLKRVDDLSQQQATFSGLKGSRTARAMQGGREDVKADVGRFAQDIASGSPSSVALLNAGINTGRNAGTRILDTVTRNRTARDLAGEMLLNPNPLQVMQNMSRLSQPTPALPRTTGAGLLAPTLMGVGAGLLVP